MVWEIFIALICNRFLLIGNNKLLNSLVFWPINFDPQNFPCICKWNYAIYTCICTCLWLQKDVSFWTNWTKSTRVTDTVPRNAWSMHTVCMYYTALCFWLFYFMHVRLKEHYCYNCLTTCFLLMQRIVCLHFCKTSVFCKLVKMSLMFKPDYESTVC